jgi:hypothetical protein
MTSYRTLVFGTIAVICAAAPALADSVSAKPSVQPMDSVSAKPAPQPMDSVSAKPKAVTTAQDPHVLVISGVPGIPSMVINLDMFAGFIHR